MDETREVSVPVDNTDNITTTPAVELGSETQTVVEVETSIETAPAIDYDELLGYLRKIDGVCNFTKKELKQKLRADFNCDVSGTAKDVLMQAISNCAMEQNPSNSDDSEGDNDSEEADTDREHDEDPLVAEAPSEWKALYGQVVWVFSFKMWWPCFIFNPSSLSKRSPLRQNALRKINQEHIVYYYGTSKGSDFGMIKPPYIKAFEDVETRTKAMEQKLTSKKYREQFAVGLELADKEQNLDPTKRVEWLHPVRSVRRVAKKTPNEPKPTQKKGAAPKRKAPATKKRKVEKSEKEENTKRAKSVSEPTGIDEREPEEETKEASEPEEEEEPESESESESESEQEEEFDEDFEIEVKKKKPTQPPKRKLSDGNKASPKPKAAPTEKSSDRKKADTVRQPSVSPAGNVAKILQTESTVDRAKRLLGLLGLSVHAQPFTPEHSAKAVKTLEKLKIIELTLEEMQSTGVASTVVALRKHSDAGISSAAKGLRDFWKEKFAVAASAQK